MDTIQSLWWGPMTNLERLSAASYVKNGHPYHLYTYKTFGGIINPPDGVVVKDAEEILPISEVAPFAHLANFADLFRVKLLLDRGGWWCDADSICLKPFDFPDEHVLVRHIRWAGAEDQLIMFNAHFKLPAGSPVSQWMFEEMRKYLTQRAYQNLDWEYALQILTRAALKFELSWLPAKLFIPLPWWEWGRQLEATPFEIPEECYAVHLWHTEWSQSRFDRNASYAPTCLFEQLKRRYLKG